LRTSLKKNAAVEKARRAAAYKTGNKNKLRIKVARKNAEKGARIKRPLVFDFQFEFVHRRAFGFRRDQRGDFVALRSATEFLAQNGGVVPAEAQFRVGGVTPKGTKHFGLIRIFVKKNVTFFTFDER
jgi:hypothetical protein